VLAKKRCARGQRSVFVKVAGDAELDAQIRASAVAGLLHLKDAKGRELAEKLIADSLKEDAGVDASDVIAGFGIEGAVEADEFVKSALDRAIAAEDAAAIFHASAAASAIARIHANGGGADLVPWLRELATKNEASTRTTPRSPLWAVGDDASVPVVATNSRGHSGRLGRCDGHGIGDRDPRHRRPPRLPPPNRRCAPSSIPAPRSVPPRPARASTTASSP